MTGRPSQSPGRLLAPGAGRRVILHAMHSASNWLAYAVWQEGSCSARSACHQTAGSPMTSGAPLPFEASFWAGEHPVALELGDAALLALAGFAVEGRPADDLIDP
jgi:hypothetical protein